MHAATAAPPRWSLGYLGTYSEDRQPLLERLLLAPARELQDDLFVVAGSKYPDTVRWPDNVSHISHLAPRQHSEFYCSQRYALNVTRSDMKSLGFSPSVRLFEATACGTPLISDDWPGIETVFSPGSEILVASGARDVVQILSEIPDDRRLTIASNARARLFKEHTPAHRARQLETYYHEARARRQSLKSANRRRIEFEEVK